jgi:hypothetical protein
MKQLAAFAKEHPYLTSYLFVFGLLQIGLISTSGLRYAPSLWLLFLVPFLLCYFLVRSQQMSITLPKLALKHVEWFLFAFAVLVIFLHLFWLGKIPFMEAWQASKLSQANMIRKMSSAGLPKWLHYASTWSIRAILPTTTLLFLIRKNYFGFILSIGVGCFYGLALLQKSLIFWVGFPVLVYFFLNRKWWAGILSTVVMGVLFVVAVFANNPQLHGGQHDLKPTLEKKGRANIVSEGILKRIFIVPGKTMSMWFAHVPKDKPYLYGRDFGPYAKLTGQKTADYNLELYALFYPDYAEQGIQGSVNTAHFMRAYANFGWWGLPFSAVFLAFFFQFLNIVHRETTATLAFSLQIFPLLLLSSGSLLTLLFSGGWGLILLLLLSSPTMESSHV